MQCTGGNELGRVSLRASSIVVNAPRFGLAPNLYSGTVGRIVCRPWSAEGTVGLFRVTDKVLDHQRRYAVTVIPK